GDVAEIPGEVFQVAGVVDDDLHRTPPPLSPGRMVGCSEAARRRGETALGYRLVSEANAMGKSYGVHTNPKKSEEVTFSAEDKIIVIAQD
ncbi:MAG: hypothetical protein V4772_03520, partial [Pseudomonadota bacterium]